MNDGVVKSPISFVVGFPQNLNIPHVWLRAWGKHYALYIKLFNLAIYGRGRDFYKTIMNRKTIKLDILTLLEKGNTDKILQLSENYPEHLILNALFSALCNPLENVRWGAVDCFGKIVPHIAERDIEDARLVMRRFLWSLNDESGGIGWGAPESLAEIMCQSTRLRREYLHMLLSYMHEDGDELFQDGNYLELPMLQRGLLWGIGRLCQCHTDEMVEQNIIEDVAAFLTSSDSTVAGMAIWSLGLLNGGSIQEKVATFLESSETILIYRNNLLQEVKIGHLAREALQLMDN